MAEILIKNMEMPNTCRRCLEMEIPVRCRVKAQEPVTAVMIGYNRPNDCPLVEVPPHGDLIDRDELLTDLADRICVDDMLDGIYQPAIDRINEAKTVLEASNERE